MTDNRDDIYGRRARIGYTSPPLTTEVFPYEFYQMVPAGVTLVLTTLAIVARSKDEVDRSYDISMQAAREMAAAGVDIVVLGGVPINLSRGYANAQQIIGDLEAELKVKVSTSASAQAGAAKALGCKKAIVAHPYAHSETDRIASYAVHFGCEVLGVVRLGQRLQSDRANPAPCGAGHGAQAQAGASRGRLAAVGVPPLADRRGNRAARTRARHQRDDRAAGDRLGRFAPLRRERSHSRLWPPAARILTRNGSSRRNSIKRGAGQAVRCRCSPTCGSDNESASGSGFPFVSGRKGTAISPRI